MGKDKTKVYLYTRVYTSMQIDGYSLDAQKSRMKAFCEFNECLARFTDKKRAFRLEMNGKSMREPV